MAWNNIAEFYSALKPQPQSTLDQNLPTSVQPERPPAPAPLNLETLHQFLTNKCGLLLTDEIRKKIEGLAIRGQPIHIPRQNKRTYLRLSSEPQFSVDIVPLFDGEVLVGCTVYLLMPGETLREKIKAEQNKKKHERNQALLKITPEQGNMNLARGGLEPGIIGTGGQSRLVKKVKTYVITSTECIQQENPNQQYVVKVIPAEKKPEQFATQLQRIEQELAVTKAAYGPDNVALIKKYDQARKVIAFHLIIPNLNPEKKFCDLSYFLYKNGKKLNKTHRLQLSIALLNTLEELKMRGISHRDLKPENLIVDYTLSENVLTINKLTPVDFGLSCMTEKAGTREDHYFREFFGTSEYTTPEMAQSVLDNNPSEKDRIIQGDYADRVAAHRTLQEIWGAQRKQYSHNNLMLTDIAQYKSTFIEHADEPSFERVCRELAAPLNSLNDSESSIQNLKKLYETILENYKNKNYDPIKSYTDDIEKYLRENVFYFNGSLTLTERKIYDFIELIRIFLACNQLSLDEKFEWIRTNLGTIVDQSRLFDKESQLAQIVMTKIDQLHNELKFIEELEKNSDKEDKEEGEDFIEVYNSIEHARIKIKAAYDSLKNVAVYLNSLENASNQRTNEEIGKEIDIMHNHTLELFNTFSVGKDPDPSRIIKNPGLKIALSVQNFSDNLRISKVSADSPEKYKQSVLKNLEQLKLITEDIRETHSGRFYCAKYISKCIDSIVNGICKLLFLPAAHTPIFTTSVFLPKATQIAGQFFNTMGEQCKSPLPSTPHLSASSSQGTSSLPSTPRSRASSLQCTPPPPSTLGPRSISFG